jgi:hypothetical protein
MNLKPGDEFIITLGKKHIRLRQIDSDEREDAELAEAAV